MATNEILQFAGTDTGTNLLTQAEYLADAQRPIGNQPGVARSKLVNKALRQASLIAAGLAEYIADNQANNITDALTPQNIADYLQAAITGALGVTPPQFDNDTRLATTAFVQRALGSFAGTVSISAGGTIAQSSAGKVVVFGPTGAGQMIYLPSLVGLPGGATFTIHGFGQFDYTLAPQSGQDVFARGTILTSVPMKAADSVVLYKESDTRWVVIGGTAQEAYSPRQSASLAANGYQKLPSGLIIQWGLIATTSNPQVWTFPVAFPNSCLQAYATESGGGLLSFGATPMSKTQANIYTSNTTIGAARLIAIGF